jgi:hypothetical protein
MPLIPEMTAKYPALATETTLNGTDTFEYQRGTKQLLVLRNPTGGAISPTILGTGIPASLNAEGYRAINMTAGYPVGSIAAAGVRVINVDGLYEWFLGTCTISSGTGLTALLIKG